MLGSGLCVARIFGVRICVDFGLALLVVLLTVNLGVGLLPAWHPEWSRLLSMMLGLAAALSFLASILLHELAHAVVGRLYDIPIHSITLFIFGGSANMEEEPHSPKSEFWMAVVGPLTSLAIGTACLAGAYPSLRAALAEGPRDAFTHLGPATTLLLWLGPTNVLLAAFNMIPAFPLDGGRLLRSLLWRITKNYGRSTRTAARIGRTFAWLLIGIGAAMMLGLRVPYLGGGLGQGLWLALIGWFLDNAAAAAEKRQGIVELFAGRPLGSFVRTDVATVGPDTSLEGLAQRLGAFAQPIVPVLRGELLVGAVSRDRLRRVPRQRWPTTLVGEVMLRQEDLDVVSADEHGAEALEKLRVQRRAAVPVTRGARFLGLLYSEDLTSFLDRARRHRRRAPPTERTGHDTRRQGGRGGERPVRLPSPDVAPEDPLR